MNKSKFARRACTATLASALVIALSSCSGATNTYGNLNFDDVYASVGEGDNKVTVTKGELWDELKWDCESNLENEINNVILQDYITNITTVENIAYGSLTDSQKTALNVSDEAGFNKLKKEYDDRLVDYVMKDIYGFEFGMDDYYSDYKSLEEYNRDLDEAKYVDSCYSTYQVDTAGPSDTPLADLVEDAGEDDDTHYANCLTIANDDVLRQAYYVDLARELFAIDQKKEEVEDAWEDDDDEDDDVWGYFKTSEFISQFRTEYTHLNNVDMVMIKFTSEDEFNNTLRSFGIKVYNSKLYYLSQPSTMSYEEYCDYYDDFTDSKLPSSSDDVVIPIDNDVVLELYVQMYNYVYGGYRTLLSTGNSYTYPAETGKPVTQLALNDLRNLTDVILADYAASDNATAKCKAAKNYLIENYSDRDEDTRVIYTADEIDDISTSFGNYLYDTLDVDTPSKCFSTSAQVYSSKYYAVYKLKDEDLNKEENGDDYETLQKYMNYYSTDLSNYEILKYITDNNLRDYLENELIKGRITESVIDEYFTDELDDVTVKIYNEAVEIAYLAKHSDYSKTLSGSSDQNLLATVEYNDVTYKIQIVADAAEQANDTDSVKVLTIPGSDKPFGMYDLMELTSGATTAIDLLSNKIIKTTNAYVKTDEDRDTYEEYIEGVLYQFSNGSYSANGYDSSIGKYNFLMLYYHTANIDEIIDNFYRVQYASVKLLTDYSSDSLVKFFQTYSDLAYKDYFSMTATRLVVYFDGDDDGTADTADTMCECAVCAGEKPWYEHVITAEESSEFAGKTREVVAKQLIYEVYSEIAASTEAHTDELSSIVTEIQGCQKAEYDSNPIAAEYKWAKYLHLGLQVKTEDVTVTNSTVNVDFNIKQRLYDYARGYNTDHTKTYQYYVNDSYPTCYIEDIQDTDVTDSNDVIVRSDDGFNLLLVTEGSAKASAEFTEKDNDEGILTDVYFKYNDINVTVSDIYNEGELNTTTNKKEYKLNANQIKYYILDYALNSSSTLAPTALSDAYSAFLESSVSRYTASETQRIILLTFLKQKTGLAADTTLYDVIKFDNEAYNGETGVFAKFIEINERAADEYNYIYNDTTNTSNPYTYEEDGKTVTWWSNITSMVSEFLLEDTKEAE